VIAMLALPGWRCQWDSPFAVSSTGNFLVLSVGPDGGIVYENVHYQSKLEVDLDGGTKDAIALRWCG
jgi:hypothetical protein